MASPSHAEEMAVAAPPFPLPSLPAAQMRAAAAARTSCWQKECTQVQDESLRSFQREEGRRERERK